jgi:hypothetical protein
MKKFQIVMTILVALAWVTMNSGPLKKSCGFNENFHRQWGEYAY